MTTKPTHEQVEKYHERIKQRIEAKRQLLQAVKVLLEENVVTPDEVKDAGYMLVHTAHVLDLRVLMNKIQQQPLGPIWEL